MRRKRNSYKDSIVFGSVFEWNWHVKLSLIVLFICFAIQAIIADPFIPKNITLGILNVIYLAVFPLIMIWFAENLDEVFGDAGSLPFEIIIRVVGWILLLTLLFLSIPQLWSEN